MARTQLNFTQKSGAIVKGFTAIWLFCIMAHLIGAFIGALFEEGVAAAVFWVLIIVVWYVYIWVVGALISLIIGHVVWFLSDLIKISSYPAALFLGALGGGLFAASPGIVSSDLGADWIPVIIFFAFLGAVVGTLSYGFARKAERRKMGAGL